MKNKVEHIENQYTSQENKKKQRQKMKMRVVRRRIKILRHITCDNCCFINLACCPKTSQ